MDRSLPGCSYKFDRDHNRSRLALAKQYLPGQGRTWYGVLRERFYGLRYELHVSLRVGLAMQFNND
jgi:hypothetical protein